MSSMTSYDNFLRIRIDNILSELIQIDLNIDSSQKKRKKKILNLFLQNRGKFFIKMKEKQIIPRKEHFQSNIIKNIAISNVGTSSIVI
jgi:hypothetical protein